jgi:hypothetical protein
MITERTLKKWRREALGIINRDDQINPVEMNIYLADRILRMTQELMDQHLVRIKK